MSRPDAREPTGSLTLRVVWPPNAALRKNLGFYRASCGYDFIPLETSVTSKLTLVKRGAHLQLAINGHVSIDWVDDGVTRGAVWGAAPLREILQRLKAGLAGIYGDRLKGVYLYGSRVRGDARPDSDVDIAVVLDDFDSPLTEITRMSAITADLSLEADLVLSVIPIRQEEWGDEATIFLRNAKREAVSVG